MNVSDVRKAHKILDDLFKRKPVLDEEREFLRKSLPELPKQKALAEIIAHVDDAWSVASGNDWGGNSYDTEISIEDWLTELYEQLKGLIDTPVTVPALPAGIRLADHEQFGRVVTSPKPDQDGVYVLLVPRPKAETGADWTYAHECELTFVDAEPAAPAPEHPEFLETEADYENAPVGTVAIHEDGYPWTRIFASWVAYSRNDYSPSEMAALRGKARVLRWGNK